MAAVSASAARKLAQVVAAIAGPTPQERPDFCRYWRPVPPLRRGDFLICPGQLEHRLYFVS